jgi:hypothetical protein
MTCRMGRLYIPRLADLCLAAFLLGAAAGAASRADEADYESRIGVLNDCLSIRNGALAPGTPVTIIRFNSQEDEPFVSGDTRERRIAARIVAKTDTAACPAWVEVGHCERTVPSSLFTRSRLRFPECWIRLNSA